MRSKFKWIFTLLLALTMQFSFAQEKTITGVVSDASGPLPGVNVAIKGTKKGVSTGFDGKYSIKAKEGETLVFSFMGMREVSKVVGASGVMNTVMQSDAKQIGEVVVVGYSTTKKKDFIGTVKEVKSEQLTKKNVSNVTQALAGEVAGVRVINTSGQPGTVGTVRIRGFGSINGNKDPLYVVDGVPYNGRIESINPNDIATTSVLKDATATAIYGSRGANGVILITTKNGKKGESFIEVESRTGVNFSLLPRYSVIKSPEEYIAFGWEGLYNRGVATSQANPVAYANTNLFSGNGVAPAYNMWNVASGADLIDPVTRTVKPGVTRKYDPENWADYAFQNSIRTEANLNLSGASDKTRYFTSLGYLKDVGYSINSDFERITGRLNVSSDVKEWFKVSANLAYTMSTTNQGGQSEDSGSVFWFVDNIPSIYPLFQRDADGGYMYNLYGERQYDYGEEGRGFGALTNAIADAKYTLERAKRNEVSTNFGFDVKLAKGLTFETKIGTQFFVRKFNNMQSKYFGPSASSNGSLYRTDRELFSYNVLELLRYKNNFGKHDLEALVAHENNAYEDRNWSAFKQNFGLPIPEFNQGTKVNSIASYTEEQKLESYFGQLNYNFDKRYYLTSTIRRDGSSRFLNKKWGNFWSLGLGWNVSNESFLKDNSNVDVLKFKASYGLTGEQAGISAYGGYDKYDVTAGATTPNFVFNSLGNPDLTWETSKMAQVGIELGLFGRIEANFDFYNKRTTNLLFNKAVAPSNGFARFYTNEGLLENKGFEFDVTAHLIKKQNAFLDLSFNGEMLANKLISTSTNDDGSEIAVDVFERYGRASGHSIYEFYLREWAGVNSANGNATWNQYYVDLNGDGVVADNGSSTFGNDMEVVLNYEAFVKANPQYAGQIKSTTTENYARSTQKFVGKSIIPDVRGAVNLSAGYKGFDISAQVLYSFGGYTYDTAYAGLMANEQAGKNNFHTDIRDRWQKPGDITDVPRLSGVRDNAASGSTRFLTKSDYIALNNVRIGYTIPKRFLEPMKISNLNVFISGDNLFLSSARKGLNPTTLETGQTSQYAYSPLTTISGGIRVKF